MLRGFIAGLHGLQTVEFQASNALAVRCKDVGGVAMKTQLFCHVRLVTLAVAPLLLGSAYAATRADVLQENALLLAARAAHDSDILRNVLSIEQKALKADDASAVRRGDRLILHLGSGATKAYVDRPECGSKDPVQESKCQKYRLIAHARSRGLFVLVKAYYEGAAYLLVNDASGEEAKVPSFPIFSPSGQHVLVILDNDAVGEYAIQVWRREGSRFVLDWKRDDGYAKYKLVRWASENTIELQAKIGFEPPKPDVTKRLSLHHTPQGWGVVEAPL
jgi:hypothetical protein